MLALDAGDPKETPKKRDCQLPGLPVVMFSRGRYFPASRTGQKEALTSMARTIRAIGGRGPRPNRPAQHRCFHGVGASGPASSQKSSNRVQRVSPFQIPNISGWLTHFWSDFGKEMEGG